MGSWRVACTTLTNQMLRAMVILQLNFCPFDKTFNVIFEFSEMAASQMFYKVLKTYLKYMFEFEKKTIEHRT